MASPLDQYAYGSQCNVLGKRVWHQNLRYTDSRRITTPWLCDECDDFESQHKLSKRSTATIDPYGWTSESEDAIRDTSEIEVPGSVVIHICTKGLLPVYLAVILVLLASLLYYLLSSLETLCFMVAISSSFVALTLLPENTIWISSLHRETLGTIDSILQLRSLSYTELPSIDLWSLGCLLLAIAIFPFPSTLEDAVLDTTHLYTSRSFDAEVIEQARYWSMWFSLLPRAFLLILPKLNLPNTSPLGRGITFFVKQAFSSIRSLLSSDLHLPHAICWTSTMTALRNALTTLWSSVCSTISPVYSWLFTYTTSNLPRLVSQLGSLIQTHIAIATHAIVITFCSIFDNVNLSTLQSISRHGIRVLLNHLFYYVCPADMTECATASTIVHEATTTATSIITTTVEAVCKPENTRFAHLLASTRDLDNMTVCFRSPEVGIFCSNAGKVFDWIEASYVSS